MIKKTHHCPECGDDADSQSGDKLKLSSNKTVEKATEGINKNITNTRLFSIENHRSNAFVIIAAGIST